MPDTPIIEALVELKNIGYRAATKLLRIMNFDSGGVPYYSPISEITDIAVAEAKEYTDSLLVPVIKPKVGDLTGTFNSSTMTLVDYDVYEVLTNDTYDSDTDTNLYRGLVYWLTDTWMVFTSENYLQLQVSASADSAIYKGTIEDDFDQDLIENKKTGWIYRVTGLVTEYQTSLQFRQGLIVWDAVASEFKQLLETAKSQTIITTEGQTEFIVTDFTLGTYLFYCNGIDVTKETSVSTQTIPYTSSRAGDTILIINLS